MVYAHKAEYWSGDSGSSGSETDEGQLSDDALRERFASGQLHNQQPKVARRTQPAPNMDAAIEAKRAEFQISDGMTFMDTFMVSSDFKPVDLEGKGDEQEEGEEEAGEAAEKPDPSGVDVEDDFAREDAIYQQALETVLKGEKLMKQAKILFERPVDYYAEMVKTDDHMRRVREKMLGDQSAIESSEKAKKQRALRKAGKSIQQDVLAKRQRDKTDSLQKIARHRKGLKNQVTGRDDFDVVAQHESNDRYKGGGLKSAKRQAKDAKFQKFGGKGKFSKSNTRESTNDDRGFNPRANKRPFNGTAGPKRVGSKAPGTGRRPSGAGGAGGASKRPGKERRSQKKR